MKACYCPGAGFPSRLQSLLFRLNKRPADVERQTEGVVKADTLGNWLAGKHYPEKHGFLQFCRACGVNSRAARDLLAGPEENRDKQRLQRKCREERLLERLYASLEQVENRAGDLTDEQTDDLCQRLMNIQMRLQQSAPEPASL
jgi:hypothetical protein